MWNQFHSEQYLEERMVFDALSHLSFDNDHKFLYFSQLGIPFETYNKNFHESLLKRKISEEQPNNNNAMQEIFHDSDENTTSMGTATKSLPLKKIKKYFSYGDQSDDQVDKIMRQEIAKEMRRIMPSSARSTTENENVTTQRSPHKNNSPQHLTAANPNSKEVGSPTSAEASSRLQSTPVKQLNYQKKKFETNPFASPQQNKKITRPASAMSDFSKKKSSNHSKSAINSESSSHSSKVATRIQDLVDPSLTTRTSGRRKEKIDRPWKEPHKPWKGKEKVNKEEVKTVIMEQFEEMNQITAQLRLLERKK